MSGRINQFWAIVWKMIDQADVVVEVIDARFPSICRSNRLEQKVMESDHCNLLIAMNKADLIPRPVLNTWIKWFDEHEGIRAVGVSARERLGTSRIRGEILRKSRKKTATVAIVGLPNTGKSSLINTLKGRKSAPTAPIAGHTRALQKIKISNSIMAFDTPGVIPAMLPTIHKYLLGVIPINNLTDPEQVSLQIIEQFEQMNPGKIFEFYDIEPDINQFLENLAIKYKRVVKGGVADTRTAAIMFLKDHIRGKIPIYEDPAHPLRY